MLVRPQHWRFVSAAASSTYFFALHPELPQGAVLIWPARVAKHPRFHLHFTPKGASWMNLVERFFAELTTKRIRRGVFTSVGNLGEAIHDYLDHHNADPKPFVWTKTAKTILAKERRALEKLQSLSAGNQASESEH